MAGVNPYGAPGAPVGEAAGETQPVRLFSVSGRIGRIRYIGYGALIYFCVGILVAAAALLGGEAALGAASIIGYGVAIVLGVMLTIQRSHDFNVTGWLSLLVFVPLANLIFWFIPGTDAANRWGPPTPANGVGVILAALIVPFMFVAGVLAAIAIPAYSDYTHRARISEVLLMGYAWRTAVNEHYAQTRQLPSSVGKLRQAVDAETGRSRHGTATLGADGVITLTMSSSMGPVAEKTILLRPTIGADTLQWDCFGGTVPAKFRPSMCRAGAPDIKR